MAPLAGRLAATFCARGHENVLDVDAMSTDTTGMTDNDVLLATPPINEALDWLLPRFANQVVDNNQRGLATAIDDAIAMITGTRSDPGADDAAIIALLVCSITRLCEEMGYLLCQEDES